MDGSAGFADPDGDLMTTWQEWQADTNPTNATSCLRITSISPGPPASVTLQTSASRLYTLLGRTNLTEGPWTPISGQTDIPGTGDLLNLADSDPAPSKFYRVSVRLP